MSVANQKVFLHSWYGSSVNTSDIGENVEKYTINNQ